MATYQSDHSEKDYPTWDEKKKNLAGDNCQKAVQTFTFAGNLDVRMRLNKFALKTCVQLVLPCFSIGYRPPRPRGQVRYPRFGQYVGRCGDRGLERPDAPCDT
eukprot:5030358-Amphidinium_carterae.1